MEILKEKQFDVDSYVKNTIPLTDDEFSIMVGHDNDEISIDDLDFKNKDFDTQKYCRNT
jgi:hypothetical protein